MCAHPERERRAVAGYIRTREPEASDWHMYMRADSGMSPYQQRQLAQLTTSSEYAAYRGKRGACEEQLCDCGARMRETSYASVYEG